jgi:hypothetical protein
MVIVDYGVGIFYDFVAERKTQSNESAGGWEWEQMTFSLH